MAASPTVSEVARELRAGVNVSTGEPESWTAFCRYWPSTKSVLKQIQPYMAQRFGIVGELIVTGVICGGDALHKEKCP